jgi:RHS repeat-associated protein
LHFHLADPLGTRRIQTNIDGQVEESCQSLPFGDNLNCTTTALTTADDATEHHFTGKEHDAESGNDYFDARYYSSTMGRFMSPDWSAQEEPIPYAKLDEPQSLNLYAYLENNPLAGVDADGHDGPTWTDVGNFVVGAANAFKSDNALGIGRDDQKTTAGQAGAIVGDDVAGITGGLEADFGIGAGVAGLASCGTVALCPEGVATAAGGAALASHGISVDAMAAKNMLKTGIALFKAGGKFSPKTARDAKDAAGGKCKSCGRETTPGQKSAKGVKPLGSEGQTDHIHPKSKGGTNEPSNAQHLCRDCNIKKSNKVTN